VQLVREGASGAGCTVHDRSDSHDHQRHILRDEEEDWVFNSRRLENVQGCLRLRVYEMEFHSEEETRQYHIHLSLEAVCRQLQHLGHALVQDTMEPIFAPSCPT